MKELAAFSIKDQRTAYTIMQVMESAGITIDELGTHTATAPRPKSKPQPEKKKAPEIFLKPGETELIDLACKCGGQMLIEALCSKQAMKEKCLRVAICTECNTEVKIR